MILRAFRFLPVRVGEATSREACAPRGILSIFWQVLRVVLTAS